jgi:endonuclease YncB( thermonuclease family)
VFTEGLHVNCKERTTLNMRRLISLAGLVLQCLASVACAQDRQPTSDHHFVASSSGRVYYRVECDAWKGLSSANLRYFRTAAEAEKAGYTPSQSQGCATNVAAAPIAPRIGGTAQCIIARVVDGDTVECTTKDRVRLLMIDTPELSQRPYGDSAKLMLARLLPIGTRARLDFDVTVRDKYDRILAHVYSGALHINRAMVRQGFALTLVIPPNIKHVESIRAAVDSARNERRGLWRLNAFSCTPADYRSGRCGRGG